MNWKEKFQQLERMSRKLEPGLADRRRLDSSARQYAESFLEQLENGKTYIADHGQSELLDADIAESGVAIDELLTMLGAAVDTPGINPASGGHLGYIPGGGIFPAAIGDYLADIANRYSGEGSAKSKSGTNDWINPCTEKFSAPFKLFITCNACRDNSP